ncbi:MAG: hypothetical protein AAF449_02785, partial [Myxococcota bacterium]
MAPEQIIGASEVGPPADLYALGMMMYAMLSGEAPFTGTTVQVVERQLNAMPPPLNTETGLEAVTMQLIQKQPEHRPQSGHEVVAVIDQIVGPTQAAAMMHSNPSEWPSKSDTPFVSRTTLTVAAFALLAITVAFLSAFITTLIMSQPEVSLNAPQKTVPILTVPAAAAIEGPGSPLLAQAAPIEEATDDQATGSTNRGSETSSGQPPKAASATNGDRSVRPAGLSVSQAMQYLQSQGLTRTDIRYDRDLARAWKRLVRAAKANDSLAAQAASDDLHAAVDEALTGPRIQARIDRLQGRLQKSSTDLRPSILNALEDNLRDLRRLSCCNEEALTRTETIDALRATERRLRRERRAARR